ncbi:MAG: methyltransferase [Proteobacteria bacterium]|nr:methyltransferase [Pseudomonadota bacterium]MCP4917756.1 methyltransferase [Pseudomonadota bacterium]
MVSEPFARLGALLASTRHRWGPNPFLDEPLPWRDEAPELAAALDALPIEAIEALELQPGALPDPFGAWLAEAAWEVPMLPRVRLPEARWSRGVKGRKIGMIEAFGAVVNEQLSSELVDWCSGQGHLARALCLWGERTATCVEVQPEMCERGARRLGGHNLRFVCADVLEADLRAELIAGRSAVALHACGDLTIRLLEQSAELDGLAFAPCCYHATERASPAISAAAVDLAWEDQHIRLALTGEYVATSYVKRSRRKEQAWRCAFDRLMRAQSGRDVYHPTKSCPRSWLSQPFEGWARQMAEFSGYDLAPFDADNAEAAGWERARLVRARGLVRSIYRPLLELFLAMDRAMWLEERGRVVQLGRFCPPEVTPRNLVIVAR